MPKAEQLSELVTASRAAAELSTSLPRLIAAFEAHQKAVEQLEADKAAVAAERAALDKREKALAVREESCRGAEQRNEQALEALKSRESELVSKKADADARAAAAPQKKAAPQKMDSLSMQVLARATATALLKHNVMQQQAAAEAS